MIELDIIKIDNKGVCVGIKRMTDNDWKNLKKQKGYIYRAFQIGYHQFKIGV
jgi:hypothetical protein